MIKTIRPLVNQELAQVVDYFLNLSPEDDARMGTDRKNLLSREEWIALLIEDSQQPLHNRQFCYLGFFLDDQAIGHTNANKINFGNEAYIHLHVWDPRLRQQGLGYFYFKQALDYYFHHFELKKIICEPNVKNPQPIRTLLKSGFKWCRTYRTKPSILSLEHDVHRYELQRIN
jgi:RimJ/RimL family protein N-acetyltransferase